jgi:hypothetical protein
MEDLQKRFEDCMLDKSILDAMYLEALQKIFFLRRENTLLNKELEKLRNPQD